MQLKSSDVLSLAGQARIMADRLASVPLEALPPEIGQAMVLARRETTNLGGLLKMLPRAKRKLRVLARTIDRLAVLAEEAAGLPEEDADGRRLRQERFVQLARFVALMAGRADYDLPELCLLTGPQARAARSALRPLQFVKSDLAAQLEEQERNLFEAAKATVEFFLSVERAFPEALAENEPGAPGAGMVRRGVVGG
jgi:hypothetical protein